jgi:hypothetical protein
MSSYLLMVTDTGCTLSTIPLIINLHNCLGCGVRTPSGPFLRLDAGLIPDRPSGVRVPIPLRYSIRWAKVGSDRAEQGKGTPTASTRAAGADNAGCAGGAAIGPRRSTHSVGDRQAGGAAFLSDARMWPFPHRVAARPTHVMSETRKGNTCPHSGQIPICA